MKIDPKEIRRKILKMAYQAQCAHVACAFSIVEILCVLYENYPDDEIILSKGHGAMALYAVLNTIGKIPDSSLENYFKNGSDLHGLVPGMGSMGHGLPVAVGMALGLQKMGSFKKVFCIVGDGEMQEGSSYEAMEIAAREKLDHLKVIVDENGWQAMMRTDRFEGACDGHSLEELSSQLDHPWGNLILAKTIKGKGVSFMEDDNSWHYKRLTEEDYQKAMKELEDA